MFLYNSHRFRHNPRCNNMYEFLKLKGWIELTLLSFVFGFENTNFGRFELLKFQILIRKIWTCQGSIKKHKISIGIQKKWIEVKVLSKKFEIGIKNPNLSNSGQFIGLRPPSGKIGWGLLFLEGWGSFPYPWIAVPSPESDFEFLAVRFKNPIWVFLI